MASAAPKKRKARAPPPAAHMFHPVVARVLSGVLLEATTPSQ